MRLVWTPSPWILVTFGSSQTRGLVRTLHIAHCTLWHHLFFFFFLKCIMQMNSSGLAPSFWQLFNHGWFTSISWQYKQAQRLRVKHKQVKRKKWLKSLKIQNHYKHDKIATATLSWSPKCQHQHWPGKGLWVIGNLENDFSLACRHVVNSITS